jgi:hypothetical protein
MLGQYTELFKSQRATFPGIPPIGLAFQEEKLENPDSPPLLDPNASRPFVLYQQSIGKILELVDAILGEGSTEI